MNLKNESLERLKRGVVEGCPDIRVFQASGAARTYLLACMLMEIQRPVMVVTPTAKEAVRFHRELEFFLPEASSHGDPLTKRLYDFPVYDISPLAGLSPHRDVITRRLQGLYALMSRPGPILVTSAEALQIKVLPKEAMTRAVDFLEAGEDVDREELIRRLEGSGYLRTSLVEERGDYSVRGGVIDVFPPFYPDPLRLEFWGDRIESIRYFEALSQRSSSPLQEVVILPAGEIIMAGENVKRARSMGRLPVPTGEVTVFPGQEAWLNHFYDHLHTLFDYFPRGGLLILMDRHRIERELESFAIRFQTDVEKYRREAEERKTPFPELEGVLVGREGVVEKFDDYQQVQFAEVGFQAQEPVSLSIQIAGDLSTDLDLSLSLEGKGRVSMAPFAEKVSRWLEQGERVVLVCRTEQQAHRLQEILRNYGVTVEERVLRWGELSPGRGLSICMGRLAKGFVWPETGIRVVSEDEIFGTKKPRARTRTPSGESRLGWTSFSQLKAGDLVVHEEHGIGRYGGLCKMEVEQKVNDFLIIEYAQNDRLYVPADRVSILQKYVGADDRDPKLDQLGGRSWDVAKQKAKRSVREIARQLVDLYAVRRYRRGFAFSSPDHYFREFEASFEHEETSDQAKAIEDLLADMESDRPMDRLVCGDVGYGKTEVALRAAFKAVMDGKQVAMLVPTTVLAEQHHETFRKRMASYPIRIAVLSRFKTREEQREILGRARSGKIDILIGTHRLLQKDVSFADLGLLIVDEEQRFGVRQKETLKSYRAIVDVLALTATPIPRTLQLSLLGIRDLSIIETPPEDRLAIQTYLCPYDEETITRALESELARGGQVFFVHNRVQTIEAMTGRLRQLVPRAAFAVAHGQMKERDLEDTMIRFLRREVDVLVCTTIIESGLDIPSVNTIIINEVDRFGLSQIYQLRGRVGRSSEMAYAYLLVSDGASLTKEAEKRLRALMEFSHLGAGIQLAMHDLKIRGGGNILGFSQSGHISAIGYELYLKLVEQTIAELKGEEWHEEINPEINVSLPAYLPGDYISDTDVRLNLYRRLSALKEEADLMTVTEEMRDRFGPFPQEVANLLSVMSVRLLLKSRRILRLDVAPEALVFTFSPDTVVKPEVLVRLAATHPGRFQFLSERKLKVRVPVLSPLKGLVLSKEVLTEWIGEASNYSQ
ncbi:MAG: transcription-repair coupling factor [Deltaproteobacteria bacterium]|nr:transcription-repair coupling factor [Deltaproteobacteria bacterium]